MIAVYILGSGSCDNNNELRLSLRSLEKHAKGITDVCIVGESVKWLNDNVKQHYLPEPQGNKEYRISMKLRYACTLLSELFLFLNDDVFFLNDVDVTKMPSYHKGKLRQTPAKGYQESVYNTFKILKKKKLKTYNYGTHRPFIIDPEKYLQLDDFWKESKKLNKGLITKAVYGNVFCLDGVDGGDVKIQTYDGKLEGKDIISCSDRSYRQGLKQYLFSKFDRKSKFEI